MIIGAMKYVVCSNCGTSPTNVISSRYIYIYRHPIYASIMTEWKIRELSSKSFTSKTVWKRRLKYQMELLWNSHWKWFSVYTLSYTFRLEIYSLRKSSNCWIRMSRLGSPYTCINRTSKHSPHLHIPNEEYFNVGEVLMTDMKTLTCKY